jgi:hypothetical protein
MTSIRRFILSSIVCGGFAAGCVAAPADEQPAADTVETVETEQSLGASTQAQERLVTYYNEAALINIVGSCFGPYRCFGPKGTTCTGRKTAFYTVEWFDCEGP